METSYSHQRDLDDDDNSARVRRRRFGRSCRDAVAMIEMAGGGQVVQLTGKFLEHTVSGMGQREGRGGMRWPWSQAALEPLPQVLWCFSHPCMYFGVP